MKTFYHFIIAENHVLIIVILYPITFTLRMKTLKILWNINQIEIKIKNGKNSWNKYGYGNPTPPIGSGIHSYYLFIFPVSSKISTIYFNKFIKNIYVSYLFNICIWNYIYLCIL